MRLFFPVQGFEVDLKKNPKKTKKHHTLAQDGERIWMGKWKEDATATLFL